MRLIITVLTSFLLIIMLITGCSSRPPIELINSYAEICDETFNPMETMDEGQKGEVYQLISLNYYFTLLNASNETIGGMEINPKTYMAVDGIVLTLEPNKKLKKVFQEVLGIDDLIDIGFGRSGIPKIEPGMEEEYMIYFVLGANKETPEFRLAPSQEQLDKIERNSMEATLVVSIGGDEEIARFDLTK